jgi:hypothetical protein
MLRIDVSVVHANSVTPRNKTPPALALATGFIGTAITGSFGNDPDWSLFTKLNNPKSPPGSQQPGTQQPGTQPPKAPPAIGARTTE